MHSLFRLLIIWAPFFFLAWFFPHIGDSYFRRIENRLSQLASRKVKVVFGIFLLTVGMRLLLLSVLPVPVPFIHDEFSYLLAGDTFAHGRLANPAHPQWLFLETFHVLQHPTYASMYPPAQGVVLAFGEMLGAPWLGVLVCTASMCAAVTWAIQGWLPGRWALIGGILVVLQIGLISKWMNGYWGGAIAALGGAIVIGALPRVFRRQRPRDSVLLGVGASILANSRPLEGFIFCVPVFAALILWMISKRSPPLALLSRPVILPLSLVIVLMGCFMAYYNWRVAGNAFTLPEMLDEKTYTNAPIFVWQHRKPALQYNNVQFAQFYNVEVPALSSQSLKRNLFTIAREGWYFFVGHSLTILLLTFPWLFPDRRIRLILIQCALSVAGFLVVVWFFPHYAAPLTASIFILLTQAMRHFRKWQVRGRPIGLLLSRSLILLLCIEVAILTWQQRQHYAVAWSVRRAKIVEQLNTLPGHHLVLVNYDSNHEAHHEWVYNSANIDGSKIVWAREIPGRDMTPLLDYFRDRKVWVVQADSPQATLVPYEPEKRPDAAQNRGRR